MKPTVYMEEMDAFTYREKLAKDAVVFIPVGALEQHGSHMAMCVDAALTKAMAGATAEALVADTDGAMEAVVAAPINYGYRSQQRSGGGFHLSGTTSLSGTTLIALAKDVVFGLILHGARKIVLMNGHYENYQFIFEGAELALEKARENGIRDVKIQLLSYWDFVDDETIEATVHAVGWNDDPAKAKGAAHTYALKYYLFEKFTVDQGEDDPDNSDFGAQGKGSGAGGRQQATQGRQGQSSGRLSDAQLARLYKKAEAAGMTKERTNARIVEKYKKQDPATLTRQEYDEICTSLDNAAAQHNQQGGNA